MTKDEALKLALEALETELCIDWTNNDEFSASAEQMHEAITAIKEALAQPEKRPWVGLTNEAIWLEYQMLWPFHPAEESQLAKDIVKFTKAIEAKLKEKNT